MKTEQVRENVSNTNNNLAQYQGGKRDNQVW